MDFTRVFNSFVALQFTVVFLLLSGISVPSERPAKAVNKEKWKDQVEALYLDALSPMDAGADDFTDFAGWDGGPYRVSIVLNYRTNNKGQRYLTRQPQFFVMQRGSNISAAMASIGVQDAAGNKIRYKCIPHPDSRNPSIIHFGFEQYITHKNVDKPGDGEKASIQFVSPDGSKWKACTDTTLVSINDTTVPLKWKVEKM